MTSILRRRPIRRWLIVTVMDFAMSAKASDYHKRLTEFMAEYVFPAEADYDKYREEAGPNDHTVPPVIEELKVKAKGRRPVEPVPARRIRADQPGVRAAGRADRVELWRSRPRRSTARRRTPATWRPCTCSPPRSSASSGCEPLLNGEIRSGVLDDRTRRRQQRRPQHRDLDRARRRRLRDQRPQVVDVGRGGPALQDPDRDGPHQPRGGQPPAAVDGAGADRHPGRDRGPLHDRSSATRTSTGTARSSTTTSGCRSPTCSAKRAPASRSPRPGSARAASTTACARSAEPNARWR